MRDFLAAALLLNCVVAANIGLNLPCNRELNGLLAADPDGNTSVFLSCQGSGANDNSKGYWIRNVCPDNMVFDFIKQQCRQQKYSRPPTLNIAILNNSCANGEVCIGGTVCDSERQRCLCPYGTIPRLEKLSCVKPQSSIVSEASSYAFNSFGNNEKSPSTSGGFLPNPSHSNVVSSFFRPPWFNFSSFFSMENFSNINFNNQNSNNKQSGQNYARITSQTPITTNESVNLYSNSGSQWLGTNPSIIKNGNPNEVHEFSGLSAISQPPPSPTLIFQPNFLATTSYPEPTRKPATLARPGQSCRENEICTGGSICTHPIALCLCPGELEERDGECVLPPTAAIQITKAGIGSSCSDLVECDHGSSCVMGHCACVAPLIQHNDVCVLMQEHKEVGPGEPCDNGNICACGSVCDSTIPVCVCPPNTDLNNGSCVDLMTISRSVSPALTNVPMAPFKQGQLPQTPSQYSTNQSQPMFVSTATSPSIRITSAPQASLMPSQEAHAQYYSTSMPPMIKSFVKPDRMMVSSGKKQSGVGVKCSLNTDCMIGAYCNGNTNPPSCQCLSTHVDVDGHCERVLYPGQIGCHSDLQCTAAYTGTYCVDRICVCPVGFKEVDQTCVSANESVTSPPGGSCTDGRVCINGSVCRNGWCVCPDPSMIVQRGICIHSEPRRTSPSVISKGQTQSTGSHVNIIHPMHGRKIAPGSSCGPLDSCDGGSMCVDGLCVCAAGMKSSTNGLCVPVTTSKPSMSSVLVLNPGTPIYARPRQKCSGGEICVGGGYCNEKGLCTCPPEKPILHGDECTMQQFSGIASPGESCDKNTACTQGSTCDRDAGICVCPPGHTVIGAHCQIPATHSSVIKPAMTPSFINTTLSSAQKILTPTTPSYIMSECLNDTQCGERKACVMGRCKCKSGFFDHNGICKPPEDIEIGERSIPISYAKHKAETLSSERVFDRDEIHESASSSSMTLPRTHSKQTIQQTRVVGPPIRQLKPQNKSETGFGAGNYKTGTGNGACPPGNEPTRDSFGRLIMCNGLEPNCPPRSYCYITSGGFATEEYNCCKSW